MVASSHRLTTAIATRLRQALPRGYRIEAAGASLRIFRGVTLIGSSPAADIADADDGRTLQEKTLAAVYAILGAVQDIVSEDSRDPWPVRHGQAMALPYVEIKDGQVHLGYGAEREPTIPIESIPFDDLVGRH